LFFISEKKLKTYQIMLHYHMTSNDDTE